MFQVEFSSHISLSVIILLNDDYRINFKFRNFGFYMCNFFIQFWIYWHQILKSQLTALFNNMRTLKFERSTYKCIFSLLSIKCWAGLPSLRLLLSTVLFSQNCVQRFDYCALGSSPKLGGATEHLIDGSEKCILSMSFEFQSLHVIERHSKMYN